MINSVADNEEELKTDQNNKTRVTRKQVKQAGILNRMDN